MNNIGLVFLADPTTRLFILAAFVGMALDIATGFANAAMHHELSSEKMRVGLWHKFGFCALILLGIYVQWVETIGEISSYLGFDVPAIGTVCVCICAIEILSIYENIRKITPDVEKTPLSVIGEHSDDERADHARD